MISKLTTNVGGAAMPLTTLRKIQVGSTESGRFVRLSCWSKFDDIKQTTAVLLLVELVAIANVNYIHKLCL